MHKAPAIATIAGLTLLASACDNTKQPNNRTAATTQEAPAPTPERTPESRIREQPNENGVFTYSCDMQMPENIMGDDYRFIGAAKLRNAGNIGIVVRVRASFDQTSMKNIVATRVLSLRRGQRRTVRFRIPATQQQIDEFQSSPDYYTSKACRIKATIIDTFGQPPYET